jgi:hypothetical protein
MRALEFTMSTSTGADKLISDKDLVLQFESLGDNCELGLLQRRAGVEPLGLLRFAGARLCHLITALDARFDGIADPGTIHVHEENGEYMILLSKYGFNYHTHVKVGEADPGALHRQQVGTVGFLARKLIDDLEAGEKLLVFRQNEPLSANDLIDLRIALAGYGPGTLLWVQPARPGFPPGTVVVADDRLMIGYVTRLAPRGNVPELDVRSWLAMLRNAHALRPARDEAVPPQAVPPGKRIVRHPSEIVFGRDGNASGYTHYGWSGMEEGYTWSIDDRSAIDVPTPDVADSYWLDMTVVPYVAPPALPAQILRVVVNGELVHTFDPLPRGTVGCGIPGRLVGEKDVIEIVFDHPNAASPQEVDGGNDGRRLAVLFHRLSVRPA